MFNLKITKMKKLFSLLCLVVLLGVSANVMGQGTINQQTGVNSPRTYSVTNTTGNSYSWEVFSWNGATDYSAQAWPTGTALTAGEDEFSSPSLAAASIVITWKIGGFYVLQVTEAAAGTTACQTIRRIGVQVFDLDLLVQTFDLNGTTEFTENQAARCNTDEGKIWTNDDDNNINLATDPQLGTMTYTYVISLYTVKGSTAEAALIGNALPTAKWRFTPVSTSTTPASPGILTWAITSTGATLKTGETLMAADGEIDVDAEVSQVTITATIKNIAAAVAAQYKLNFAIASGSVNIENGGASATDYAEGTENSLYTTGTGINTNSAYEIIVDPIPNTSIIAY
jgi:hypothetical protein